jgi:pyridoxal phosphate enzyme (YggS family)
LKGLEQVRRVLDSYSDITLVAVSKTVTETQIRQAFAEGVRHFGENRVQDAIPKISGIDLPITWHYIGRLQTNKVRKVAGAFALIHSLDSVGLALEMEQVGQKTGLTFECLLQVNASGEMAKQGMEIADVAPFLDKTSHLQFVRVAGLMTMAPFVNDPEETRPVFRSLRRLFEELNTAISTWPHATMRHLSMVMSNDYQVALSEGANMVRIGSAIFSDV